MTTNPEKFYRFLTEVYNGVKADRHLVQKHKISSRTQQSARVLKLIDDNHFCIMAKPPTMQDAINLMNENKEFQSNYIKIRKKKNAKFISQLKLNLPNKQTRQKSVPAKVKPATREINLLWGAIKITL